MKPIVTTEEIASVIATLDEIEANERERKILQSTLDHLRQTIILKIERGATIAECGYTVSVERISENEANLVLEKAEKK